jgi:c-di-GMP-binding flagellar brake protein YcgR
MPTFEFRKLYRVDIALKVEYRTQEEPFVEGVGLSKNLSSTGVNIVTADRLEEGTALELRVYFPSGGQQPLTARGVVEWLAECSFIPLSGKKYYTVAVHFSNMSTEDAIRGSDFVQNTLKEQSEERNREIIEKLEGSGR